MLKKIYLILVLFVFIGVNTIYASDPVLTVSNHYTGSYYVASGSFTDNISIGHHYHFTSQVSSNFVWWVKITINGEVIFDSSFGDGTLASVLDLYWPAHLYDVVNIQVWPNIITGGGGNYNETGTVNLYIGNGSIENR